MRWVNLVRGFASLPMSRTRSSVDGLPIADCLYPSARAARPRRSRGHHLSARHGWTIVNPARRACLTLWVPHTQSSCEHNSIACYGLRRESISSVPRESVNFKNFGHSFCALHSYDHVMTATIFNFHYISFEFSYCHLIRRCLYADCVRCVHVNGNRDSETQSRTCVICKLFFACGSVGSPPADKNLCM